MRQNDNEVLITMYTLSYSVNDVLNLTSDILSYSVNNVLNLTFDTYFRKHGFFWGFAVQISFTCGLRHREVIASSASKTASVAAEQRAFETSLRDNL